MGTWMRLVNTGLLCVAVSLSVFSVSARAEAGVSATPVDAVYRNQPQASNMEPRVIAASASDSGILGTWVGFFRYASGGQPAVPFLLDIMTSGPVITGDIKEPNTFGDPREPFLFATVDGVIRGTSIRFTKTYDGTAGQSHSVQYSGVYNPASRTIRGRWSIGPTNGTFEAKLRQ